ncbi:Transposase and inactivated derivatives [Roseburia hominis]|nr:IS200/IS605 family transposase [Catenibacterium mitsuokai]CUP00956.1 Transposase and inactivated derivatives [Catenibacterium mitsuokai]CUQ08580.1 Transposase and inactivated derivatives [Roseburia hominis]
MNNRYNRYNRRKYSLKVHIVLVTKYRKQLLKDFIADDVKQEILHIANTRGYEIIAIETDKDHIHFLLSYDTTDRVYDIVKIVKQETTYHLWQKYSSVLSKQYWKEKHFGQMVNLLVALEKCHQQLYKNILKVRDNR